MAQQSVKPLVAEWIRLKESLKKPESDEDAAERKALNERKSSLQQDLMAMLKRDEIECGKVDIGAGMPRYVRIKRESRPRPVSVEVARAAVSTGLTSDNIKAMIANLVATTSSSKPVLMAILHSAVMTTIRELTANHVERLEIGESRKRKRTETDEEYLSIEIQRKAAQLHGVTEQLSARTQKKTEGAERRERLKEVEAQLGDHLVESSQAYNYSRNIDGEIRYFHVKAVETIEPKPVTVTAAKDVVNDALDKVFTTLKIDKSTVYNKSIGDDILSTLQKEIGQHLVDEIKRYETEHAKEVRKLQIEHGRA